MREQAFGVAPGSRRCRASRRPVETAATALFRARIQIRELSEIQPLFRPIGSRRSPLHCLPWSERLAPTTQQASVAGMTGRIAASSRTAVRGAAPRPTDWLACRSMVRFRKHVVLNSRNPVSRWTPATRNTRHQKHQAVAVVASSTAVRSGSSQWQFALPRSNRFTQHAQYNVSAARIALYQKHHATRSMQYRSSLTEIRFTPEASVSRSTGSTHYPVPEAPRDTQ